MEEHTLMEVPNRRLLTLLRLDFTAILIGYNLPPEDARLVASRAVEPVWDHVQRTKGVLTEEVVLNQTQQRIGDLAMRSSVWDRRQKVGRRLSLPSVARYPWALENRGSAVLETALMMPILLAMLLFAVAFRPTLFRGQQCCHSFPQWRSVFCSGLSIPRARKPAFRRNLRFAFGHRGSSRHCCR